MNIIINGRHTELIMKLGPEGEAYFVEKVDILKDDDSVVKSPISSPI